MKHKHLSVSGPQTINAKAGVGRKGIIFVPSTIKDRPARLYWLVCWHNGKAPGLEHEPLKV
jgi:hypothetical protein